MSKKTKNFFITYKHLGKRGRLGNQLWQICGTVGAIQQYNDINNTNYQICFPKWEYSSLFSFPQEWFVDKKTIDNSKNISEIVEKKYSFYLGNVDFIEYIYNDIEQWLKPSPLASNMLHNKIKKYEPENKTAVSIRRGDYAVWYKGANLIPKSYYQKNWPEKEVLIFSDDPEWCKKNFPNNEIINNTPVMDLMLMRMCKSHVISNSTFAWWGAFGSNNVVCPEPWVKHVDAKLILKSWKSSSWY
jgi:hypothetical protein